jgi:tetratricopeptide (TPR) repeat protein
MKCPRCQADNREGRRFCAEFGASLALPCAACGFSNDPGEKFCGGCGIPLTSVRQTPEPRASSPQSYTPPHLTEKILASRVALEGERKQVTVLFADLKGSMELLADRDPEEARQLLDPVLERMIEAVHRYEGTVNQVMGDGIMALFGAPITHEDHAVRACYAALRMQETVTRYGDEMQRSSAEALLQALLGDDPSLVPLTRLLIERTEGNPFFLEESVRALVETAVLVGARGAYRLAKPLESLQVPATVHAVLAARIDRLPPEEKRLLQTAAVIGTEVPFALLQAIGELSEAELRRGLGHLQAAEFLYETSLFPELEYTFKHALTHEVAYGSLLQERHRALHARIFEASERLYADRLTEQVERLAQHAFRGEVWDKAVAYCWQAGTRALARSAFREVVACCEQALAALKHLPESHATQEQAIDLRLDLRHALWSLGDIRKALDSLREAATLAKALDDQPRLGRVSAYMCRYFREMGHHDDAVATGQHALAVAETLGDFALQVMARHYLGVACHTLGDHRRALGLLRSNAESLEGDLLRECFGVGGLPSVLSRAWLVRCLAELGAFPEGSAHGEEAVRIAEAVNHPNSLVHAYLGVGFLSLRQRDLSRAIPMLERCLDLCLPGYVEGLFDRRGRRARPPPV